MLNCHKVRGGAGWQKAIPRPPQEGEPVARGRANEVSDTPGDAASPPRAVSAKALKGGSAPGGRWFKRRTFASRGRCPLIVLLPFQGVDCSCGLPGVALPSVADPGLQANPPSSALGWPSAILCATGGPCLTMRAGNTADYNSFTNSNT